MTFNRQELGPTDYILTINRGRTLRCPVRKSVGPEGESVPPTETTSEPNSIGTGKTLVYSSGVALAEAGRICPLLTGTDRRVSYPPNGQYCERDVSGNRAEPPGSRFQCALPVFSPLFSKHLVRTGMFLRFRSPSPGLKWLAAGKMAD